MQGNQKSFLTLSFLLLAQSSCQSQSITAHIKDALQSDTAIDIYKSIAIAVGAQVAIRLVDPALYNLRKATGSLTAQEKQMDLMYKQKLVEIEQAKFNFYAVQGQILEQGYPRYKKNLERKKEALKNSNMPEEEQKKVIAALEKKLTLIKQQKNEKSDSLFEQMLQQAGVLK